MTKNFILGSTTALLLTGAASADFIGFDGTLTTNAQGNNVVQMFAVFDNADAVALNVFNSDIAVSTSGFIHNDVQVGAGGTWVPSASLDIPGFSDSGNDSYVTIGYGVGAAAATNGTNLDPGFGETGGLGGTIPVGAGWFNGNPPNAQGASAFAGGLDGLSGYAVMSDSSSTQELIFFSFDAEIGANAGAGSPKSSSAKICSPSPLPAHSRSSDWVASPLAADAVDRTPFSFDDEYGAVGRKTIGPALWPARFFHRRHTHSNARAFIHRLIEEFTT